MQTASAFTVAHCLADADHRILSCDDAYIELLARERSEIIGAHPLDLTFTLDRALNATMLAGLAHSDAAFTITKRYVRGDGSLLWVTNTVAPVRDGVGRARVSATSR